MYSIEAGDTKYMTDYMSETSWILFAVVEFIRLSSKYKNVSITKIRRLK
jgi:hypothetical protein